MENAKDSGRYKFYDFDTYPRFIQFHTMRKCCFYLELDHFGHWLKNGVSKGQKLTSQQSVEIKNADLVLRFRELTLICQVFLGLKIGLQ